MDDKQLQLVEEWLTEAIVEIEEWSSYADDYFKEKYDLHESLHLFETRLALVRQWRRNVKDKNA